MLIRGNYRYHATGTEPHEIFHGAQMMPIRISLLGRGQ